MDMAIALRSPSGTYTSNRRSSSRPRKIVKRPSYRIQATALAMVHPSLVKAQTSANLIMCHGPMSSRDCRSPLFGSTCTGHKSPSTSSANGSSSCSPSSSKLFPCPFCQSDTGVPGNSRCEMGTSLAATGEGLTRLALSGTVLRSMALAPVALARRSWWCTCLGVRMLTLRRESSCSPVSPIMFLKCWAVVECVMMSMVCFTCVLIRFERRRLFFSPASLDAALLS
mmetsp:Transcript_19809/g.63016  ORF Transcript_19809/g.63016 Transcript_19809/m.63016 type:complete len:226 (-) Transcript_19809:190-867(-)